MTRSTPFFNHFDRENKKNESPNVNVEETSSTDDSDGFFESIYNGVSDMWDYLTNSTPTESKNATTASVNGTSPTTLAPANNSNGEEEESTAKKSKKVSKKATTKAPEEDDDYDELTTKKSVKSKKATVDDDEDDENNDEE